jgi:signal transduction histidine kinase
MSTVSSNGEISRHAHFPVAAHGTLDQLAVHAARLARQNEALDDFTGLVAHEVKSALLHALLNDDARAGLMSALELVDTILEAVRASHANGDVVAVDQVVQQALSDLGMVSANVIASASGVFPLPPAALRLVLRNLLANAIAAGADNIHISTLAGGEQRVLVVDDDGVGLDSHDGYDTGDQIGLALCRRLAARFGGVIELKPRSGAGTRAVISVSGADR